VVLVAMAVWFVLVRQPERNRAGLGAYAPLLPYAVLAAIYVAVASAGFTQSLGRGHTSLKTSDVEHAWYFLRQAMVPTDNPANTAVAWVQRSAAACLLAALPIAVAFRRWLLASLLVGFLLSLVPYSLFNLGLSPRLFYFPSALFALASGAAATEFVDVPRASPGGAPAIAGGCLRGLHDNGLRYRQPARRPLGRTRPRRLQRLDRGTRTAHPELPAAASRGKRHGARHLRWLYAPRP
jgi:hypothetical protein